MAEDANYLRCEHGWKRDAWPADRDRCPHCTGTGEAPDLLKYQSPWRDTNVVVDISAVARTTLAALERAYCPTAAKRNTTHRMPEHEREYGG